MNEEKNVLPIDFDGVFRFTNFTEEEFKARWNSVEYTFPSMKTSPMIIPGEPPENVQSIRKKFAKELAVREFYKTPKFIGMNNVSPGGTPALYTDSDLAPFIQRCLEPLPVSRAIPTPMPKDKTENYSSETNVLDATDLKNKKSLKGNDSAPILG